MPGFNTNSGTPRFLMVLDAQLNTTQNIFSISAKIYRNKRDYINIILIALQFPIPGLLLIQVNFRYVNIKVQRSIFTQKNPIIKLITVTIDKAKQ